MQSRLAYAYMGFLSVKRWRQKRLVTLISAKRPRLALPLLSSGQPYLNTTRSAYP